MLLGGILFLNRGRAGSDQPDEVAELAFTLVTADRDELACSWSERVEGHHCAFRDGSRPWGGGRDYARLLAPYRTTQRKLYVVGGLFGDPNVAARVRLDEGHDRREQTRFTARCRVRLVKPARGLRLRFRRDAPWDDARAAWVGIAQGCVTDG